MHLNLNEPSAFIIVFCVYAIMILGNALATYSLVYASFMGLEPIEWWRIIFWSIY